MSKCKLPALTLDDLVRIFDALPLMLRVCKGLDELSNQVPYGRGTVEDHDDYDRLVGLARLARRKLEGTGL